ncbi:hypothetical protein [Bradyrhizobium sp. NC92]|uniref:hypothetical protein n=1 Tax=Bradyrhizobium sp. (strain NC92) TaxID=55395 RepID=UPI0021AAC825|nr:hypothetical protein [Bradyrhizobium sp. NC92]UWU67858.1 hypothetical protein N2602_32395 [Bradyrhizobium sp. NC92]
MRRSRQRRSLIARRLLGLCLGLAFRNELIELLSGVKDLEPLEDLSSLRSDDPTSFLSRDQPLPEDIEVRLAARNALHARRPLGPAAVKDRQVLFDEFKTGSAAGLPG